MAAASASSLVLESEIPSNKHLQPMERLIGSVLVDVDGQTVSTAKRLASKTTVGLFIGAEWNEESRKASTLVSDWYKDHAAAANTEFIYVSADRTTTEFEHALGKMAWDMAVPYDRRDILLKLFPLLHLDELPQLVILDPTTAGKVCREGLKHMELKPEDFPWPQGSFDDVLAKATIHDNQGNKSTIAKLTKDEDLDLVMTFHSADWSAEAKNFVPTLMKFYKQRLEEAKKEGGIRLEIVLCGRDRTKIRAKKHFTGSKHPWWCLEWDTTRPERDAIERYFDVDCIPTLMLWDARTKEVITREGFSLVYEFADEFPWTKTAVKRMPEALRWVNNLRTALLFVDKLKGDGSAAVAQFHDVAKVYTEELDDIQFCIIKPHERLNMGLRSCLRIDDEEEAEDAMRLVFVDMVNCHVFTLSTSKAQISKDGFIMRSLTDALTGKLKPERYLGPVPEPDWRDAYYAKRRREFAAAKAALQDDSARFGGKTFTDADCVRPLSADRKPAAAAAASADASETT